MIPISPVSVKFTEEERARLKALAAILGWTESQVIRDAVAYVIYLAGHPDSSCELKLITRARLVISHEARDVLLQTHVQKIQQLTSEDCSFKAPIAD